MTLTELHHTRPTQPESLQHAYHHLDHNAAFVFIFPSGQGVQVAHSETLTTDLDPFVLSTPKLRAWCLCAMAVEVRERMETT